MSDLLVESAIRENTAAILALATTIERQATETSGIAEKNVAYRFEKAQKLVREADDE